MSYLNRGNAKFKGLSSLIYSRRGGGGAPPAGVTKAFLEGFRDNSTLVLGRTSVAPLKDPVVDAASLPAGVTQSAGTVTVASPFTGTLSDWDFTDYSVIVSTATGVTFSQCVFGEVAGVPGTYPLAVNVGGQIAEIVSCDFIGMGYGGKGQVIVQNSSGTGLSFVAGRLNAVRLCRFIDWGGDCINLSGSVGGQIVERNYFAPTNNLPYVPPAYNAGTTYALNDLIFSGPYVFRSLSNGNIGNTPPASKTNNAFWENYDPHADQITVKAAIESVTIRQNLFDHVGPPPLATWSSVGINNVIRLARNTGTDFVVGNVTVTENLMYHEGVASLPLAILMEGANTTGIFTITDNWLPANANGTYINPNDTGGDVVSGNKDSTTDANVDAVIPDRNRVTSITPIGTSTTSLNLTFTVAARGGTFYYVVTGSSTRPSAAQIIAGQDHTGSAATAAASQSITTAGAQTISGITLPNSFAGFVHVAYSRNSRTFTASSSSFSLAAIDYATRAVATDQAALAGPALPAGLHSFTVRIRFTTTDGTASAALFYHMSGNSFVCRHDNRPSKRQFTYIMENSAGTAYGLSGVNPELTYTPNTNCELIITATQDRYSENNVIGPHAGIRDFVNGVNRADLYAPTTGTGFFQSQVQNILSIAWPYIMGIRSFERWDNVWLPDGNVASLGAPTVIIDGNETLWNGTGLPAGWSKAGANAFT